MKYNIDKTEKYTVLSLNEDKLDTLVAPKLKSELVTLFQSGTVNLILELHSVKYIDSSGLSSLLIANRLCSEANGIMVLIGVNDFVNKLISISKLDNIFNVLPTREEAVDAVFLHEIEKDLQSEEEID
jgi:anti-anti-sigma factor